MTFPGPIILVNDQITNPCDLMSTQLNHKITDLQTTSAGISIIFMPEKEDCTNDSVTFAKNAYFYQDKKNKKKSQNLCLI